MCQVSDRIEMSAHEENLRDAMHEDDLWDRACPSTNSAGERCAYTLHLTGLHTWEKK
jgi:hypothetical protein